MIKPPLSELGFSGSEDDKMWKRGKVEKRIWVEFEGILL